MNQPVRQKDANYYLSYLLKGIRYYPLIVICLVASFLYALYQYKTIVPRYNVTTSVLIQEDKASDPESIIGLEGISFGKQKLQNEIGILKSYEMISRTIHHLNFETSYFSEGRFRRIRIYPPTAFNVVVNYSYSQPLGLRFYINIVNDSTIHINAKAESVVMYSYLNERIVGNINNFKLDTILHSGQQLMLPEACFTVNVIPGLSSGKENYSFEFHSQTELINSFSKLIITENSSSSILNISIETDNVNRGVEFLNTLTNEYLKKGIERKNQIASNTINFIDNQLSDVYDSLNISESSIQQFIAARGGVSLDEKTQQAYERLQSLQSKKALCQVKLDYYNYIERYINEE